MQLITPILQSRLHPNPAMQTTSVNKTTEQAVTGVVLDFNMALMLSFVMTRPLGSRS
jgi:hypothetical protein